MRKTIIAFIMISAFIIPTKNLLAATIISDFFSIGVHNVYYTDNDFYPYEVFERYCENNGIFYEEYSLLNGQRVEAEYVQEGNSINRRFRFSDIMKEELYTVTGEKVVVFNEEDFIYFQTLDGRAIESYYQQSKTGVYEQLFKVVSKEANRPSSWAIEQVNSAVSLGLVTIEMQSAYQQNTTRAEFCRMAVNFVEKYYNKTIYEVIQSKGLTLTYPFTDTQDAAISAAYALKIISGTSSNTFSPDGLVTREQAATMLSNTLGAIGISTSNAKASNFSDSPDFSSWAVNGINCMLERGIMSGVGNDIFSPKSPYTHEQAIVTFYRMFSLIH